MKRLGHVQRAVAVAKAEAEAEERRSVARSGVCRAGGGQAAEVSMALGGELECDGRFTRQRQSSFANVDESRVASCGPWRTLCSI